MQGGDFVLRDFLLDSGLVSRAQLQGLTLQKDKPLSEALIEGGVLSEEEVRKAAAHALGVPYVVLEKEDIEPDALMRIPEALSRERGIIAYRESERGVEVALLDLADLPSIEFLREKQKVLPRLTSRDSIRRGLFLYQKILKEKFGSQLEMPREGSTAFETLLSHALSQYADVIYVELGAQASVRYRINGVLHAAMNLSKKTAEKIFMHLNSLAAPEARFKVSLQGEEVLVHISLLTNTDPRHARIHLLRGSSRKGFTLESLGLRGAALEAVYETLQRRSGLIVVEGPTESGVSTTLYTLLDLLNTPNRLIMSVEEAIEYRLPQVVQTHYGREYNISALAALRAALRQDPDVLMVSGTEDESALALLEEAAKRLLVIVGLQHASRSEGSGAEALVIKQRLVRRLCPHYRKEVLLSRAESSFFEGRADFGAVLAALKEDGVVSKQTAWKDIPFFKAEACGQCEVGYLPVGAAGRGRLGLFEVRLPEGISGLSLAEDGLYKAALGLTSVAEVVRTLS
jgi:type IV pilus assembly protein PilB